MEASIEWSARIDQALEEYPEMREYLDAIRGNIEALADRLEAARELHRKDLLYPEDEESALCEMCEWAWPCPTIKALEGDQ